MIAAVDTSVLLDIFLPDEQHGLRSLEWLRTAYDEGSVIVRDIVFAELVPAFSDRTSLDEALREISATLSPINTSIAYEAGLRWMRSRRAGGPRKRIISDFLIGAHAVTAADTFLTRDRGFHTDLLPRVERL